MADDQLESALSNWGARFSANGVDPSDFAEVAATIERWEQWCAAWSRLGARHEEIGRTASFCGPASPALPAPAQHATATRVAATRRRLCS